VSATQEQTLSGRGARVYTAHRDWLGVVTGVSAASTGGRSSRFFMATVLHFVTVLLTDVDEVP